MDDQPVASPTPAPYRVAVIQFEPALFAKEANIAALSRLVEDAAVGGAKLLVTPEMATTAYCWADRAEVASEVEPIPGPSTRLPSSASSSQGEYGHATPMGVSRIPSRLFRATWW